jgi:A/G-specific adenine glycosylase
MLLQNSAALRRRLLRWYDKNRRDLPWRRTNDPYAIWIAETMLQQTQVKTALPYYERFTRTLPSVDALDRAPVRKVLALWSGLGYYRRAVNLKRAAREVVLKHGGQIPKSYESLRSLPGIGEYTAGAVMSIAFQRPLPAVDGNVRRVLNRIFGARTETELRHRARQLISRSRPGDFNQALMELGATVCLPQNPRCQECPLAPACARRLALVTAPPLSKKPIRLRNLEWPLAIIRNNGKFLLRRRTAPGILAGLWELPGGETANHESFRATLRLHVRELNGAVKPNRCIGTFRHSITNRRISSPVFLFAVVAGANLRPPNRQWRWFTPVSLTRYPVSTMTRKALTLLNAHDQSSL